MSEKGARVISLQLVFLMVLSICFFNLHGSKTQCTITIAEIIVTFWVAFIIWIVIMIIAVVIAALVNK